MLRDSRRSIGDCEIGAGVRGPAASPLTSLLVRSYAPRREGSRTLGSFPSRPRVASEIGNGRPIGVHWRRPVLHCRDQRARPAPHSQCKQCHASIANGTSAWILRPHCNSNQAAASIRVVDQAGSEFVNQSRKPMHRPTPTCESHLGRGRRKRHRVVIKAIAPREPGR
jgi:hypothetical protein